MPKFVEIDQKTFEGLCHIQCTQREVCDFLNVDDKTLTKWCKTTYGLPFSDVLRQKRGGGKVSLRRTQWRNAIDLNNTTMQIWLGKQFLGQTDKVETDNVTLTGSIERIERVIIDDIEDDSQNPADSDTEGL